MAKDRRTFLKGAGLVTAAASLAPLSLSLDERAQPGVTSAIAAQRAHATSKFALELDGTIAGFIIAYEGGNPVGDVVGFSSGTDLVRRKSLSDIDYEEIAIRVGLNIDAALWMWLDRMLTGDPTNMDGAIIAIDMESNVVRRMEFENALITEVTIPKLDAASNETGYLEIRFQPESTRLVAPGGKLAVPVAAKQKTWLTSNFRLQVGQLPCSRVSKIEALSIKQKVTAVREGTDTRIVRWVAGALEFPNLVLTASAIDAGPWQAFFDDFVIAGNNAQDDELGGSLKLLGPDLKPLATLEFNHLGIFRMAPEEVDPFGSNLGRFRADLYSEGNRLFVGGLPDRGG